MPARSSIGSILFISSALNNPTFALNKSFAGNQLKQIRRFAKIQDRRQCFFLYRGTHFFNLGEPHSYYPGKITFERWCTWRGTFCPAGRFDGEPSSFWLAGFKIRKPTNDGCRLCHLPLHPVAACLFNIGGANNIKPVFFGIMGNLVNIAMNTQAVGVESLYGRSVMASFHGFWSLAGFCGAVIGTFFISRGYAPFFHFSIVCSLVILLVLISYKYTLPHDTNRHQSQKIFVKPDKKLWMLGLISFCCLLCEGAMADWSGVYFKKIVVAPAALITLGYVAFTGTMALGRFLGDWVVTKLGVKRMLQISGTMISSGLLISVIFPYLISATAGFLLVGFGVSSVVPIVYGLAGKSTTMTPGAALAAVSSIGFLGFLIGPPVIGFIAQLISLRWSFAFIALLGFGTALLAGKLKIPEDLRKIPEETFPASIG